MSVVTAALMPAWARDYVGLPFKERGRDGDGLDCYGLVYAVYRDIFGITLPRHDPHYSLRDRVTIARLFFTETTSGRWRRVALDAARTPDVLSLRLAGHGHVGIVLTPDRFLHVMSGRETCVERLRPMWADRVEAVYRHEAFA